MTVKHMEIRMDLRLGKIWGHRTIQGEAAKWGELEIHEEEEMTNYNKRVKWIKEEPHHNHNR